MGKSHSIPLKKKISIFFHPTSKNCTQGSQSWRGLDLVTQQGKDPTVEGTEENDEFAGILGRRGSAVLVLVTGLSTNPSELKEA